VSKKTIVTAQAPAAIGPYSQGIRCGQLVFVSGQIPLDPVTGKIVEGDIATQTERVLRNLAGILEAAGSSLCQVLKTTVYLVDLDEFSAMNDVYARFFPEGPPAHVRQPTDAGRAPAPGCEGRN
jgi:2-iminobutanoate/2-iminopropanoate deaminase